MNRGFSNLHDSLTAFKLPGRIPHYGTSYLPTAL
jgi:hypothetical protein